MPKIQYRKFTVASFDDVKINSVQVGLSSFQSNESHKDTPLTTTIFILFPVVLANDHYLTQADRHKRHKRKTALKNPSKSGTIVSFYFSVLYLFVSAKAVSGKGLQ